MDKKEVQQRVLKNGKPLDLDLFNWCDKTNTFSSNESGLVIDFKDISGCTFKTGSDCTFNTGYGCTFNTGSYCVIVRRDIFEVIQQKENIKLCPYEIPGYLELIDDKWYLNGDKSQGEHIIQDGILSRVILKRGNVYKVINHGQTDTSYLVTDGENWSHGKTLKEARDSLIYKISNRDTSKYKGMKLTTKYTLEEAIKMYRVITGACEGGVRAFLDTIAKKKEYTVKEIIKLTNGQYGNEALTKFISEV